MNKITNTTPNLTEKNIDKIAELFPQVVTEKEGEDGVPTRSVDFDALRQALSDSLALGADERYRLDWPGKRASLLKANTPIAKTLRPDRASSVEFDTTENVFIEGDNFEALKILQESYLGKVKMIYIDPPYNSGGAMIYNNDFSQNQEKFDEEIGAVTEDGVRMFRNTDSNARFHSDWLSMMYERLIISRDLLSEDGFVVLAIDHNELHNLISICDEAFGEVNRLGIITIVHKPEGRNQEKFFGTSNEFALFYAKNRDETDFNKVILDSELAKKFDCTDEKGKYRLQNFIRLTDGKLALREVRPKFWYPIFVDPNSLEISVSEQPGFEEVYPITKAGVEMSWKTLPNTLEQSLLDKNIVADKDEEGFISIQEKIRETQVIKSHWVRKEYNAIQYGTKVVNSLIGDGTFDFPKSIHLIEDILKLTTDKNALVLDFFPGSATTAHAVMNLNVEDDGNRRFIMVQLQELVAEDSKAHAAGYKNIAQISRERIRRAAEKIKADYAEELANRATPLDTGFRAYTVADTAFLDVERHPSELEQGQLLELANNIKNDRTPEDLLTQVMLELGLTLDLPIETKVVGANTVFYVAYNALVACFDEAIPTTLIDEMAKCQPLQVAFKDASFGSDDALINAETHLKRLSPDTILSVI